jgi:hypothetical protein
MSYSYSTDEESYQGQFASAEDACDEAANEIAVEGAHFWVGENASPPQPETFWHAYTWLDNVSEQDEYGGEWACDWDKSKLEQRAELEAEVRTVMGRWLDRHNLRPKFWTIEKPQKFVVTAGEFAGEFSYEEAP